MVTNRQREAAHRGGNNIPPPGSARSGGRRPRRAACAWGLLLLLLYSPPSSAEAMAPSPASSPAPASATAPSVAVRETSSGVSLAEACALTADERALLDTVSDGDDQWSCTGLYVLLRRATMLPTGRQTYDAASHPNPLSFWSAPSLYRGRLVSLEAVYAGRVDEQDPITVTEWWGNRKYYLMHVKAAGAPEAIVVTLTEPPPKGLRLGSRVDVAGFFYKTMLWPVSPESGNPSERRIYPVLVARSVYEFQADQRGWMPRQGFGGLLVSLAVAMVIFAVVRIRLRARRQQAAPGRRWEPAPGRPPSDDELDPEFQRQMQQYLDEERSSDKNDKARGETGGKD